MSARRLSFMDPLVLAIMADEKTVTRRIAREADPDPGHSWAPCLCAEIDYLAWHDWAERMDKTHTSTQCPGCGLWKVWVPRA